MTPSFSAKNLDKLTFATELSPSIVYRELERYHVDTLFDPLACTTASESYFKLQNVRVIANDLSLYTYVKGKALWENNHFQIPASLAERLTKAEKRLPRAEHYKTLGAEWFTDEERKWLEYWRKVVNDIRDEYIRSMAETAVCLVIDYWITSKRFGYSADWTPPALLGFYIRHVNQSLLDNEESNEMWRTDPVELTEKVIADVLFINPPPLKGYASFGEREHILESWLRGMNDFPLAKIAPEGTIGSRFNDASKYMKAFSRLLKAAEHIPLWVFARSNRQPFTLLEFEELLESHGRKGREIDLDIARKFFSRRAPDTLIIASA
jgi:adenine-specific DNA methylase